MQMEMGYCTLNQKYSPELVRQAAIGSPKSAAQLVMRGVQVRSRAGGAGWSLRPCVCCVCGVVCPSAPREAPAAGLCLEGPEQGALQKGLHRWH